MPRSDATKRRHTAVREECEPRKGVLWANPERQHFLTRSRDIVDYMLPHAGPIMGERDGRDAQTRWRNIFDTCATEALDVATAGLMTYATPPGGEWRSLVLRDVPDPGAATKEWLAKTDDAMEAVFGQSNVYQTIYLLFRDLIGFGQGCAIVDYDPKYALWCYQVPIGDYAIAASFRGQVDTLYRELTMPMRQVVKRWGVDALCTNSREEWDRDGAKCWDKPVAIVHAIEPRPEDYRQSEEAQQRGDPVLAIEKPWRSVYWERDSGKHEGLLSESGYDTFPVLAPRYDVLPGGVYGYGPGCKALAHVRALQHRHFRLGGLIDWQTDPAVILPTRMHGRQFGPGERVYSDGPADVGTVDVSGKPETLLADIQDVRRQIRTAMGADVYAMFASLDRSNVTAEEIKRRQQEKIDILGPQTARSFDELPRPLVDIGYANMRKAGRVPEMPPEVIELAQKGKLLDVEFQGVLARSAAAFKRAATDAFLAPVADLVGIFPAMRHKVREFDAASQYHETSGASPTLLRSDEEAQAIADAEAAAKAKAEAIAQGAVSAKAASDASNVKTDEQNLVTAAMGTNRGAA